MKISYLFRIQFVTVMILFLITGFAFADENTFPSSGNVGIGTTSPNAKLDVYGNIRVLGPDGYNSTGEQARLIFGDMTSDTNAIAGIMAQYDFGLKFCVAKSDGDGSFGTYSIDAMVIKQVTGNVGIGTTSPEFILHVAGDTGIAVRSTGVDETFQDILTGIYSGNSNEQNAIQTSVSSAADKSGFQFMISDGGGSIGQTLGYKMTRAAHRFYTGGSERMKIDNSGNVGIGTTSPEFILHVAGDTGIAARSTGVDGAFQDILTGIYSGNSNEQNAIQTSVSSAADKSGFQFMISDGGGSIGQTLGYKMTRAAHRFYTGGSERMKIDNSGNVGIGTTNPQSLLAVNGTITTKEVKVTSTGWSDFVFDEGYNLPSLSQVESYIEENNHLPEIPSAKEIEDNGLSMAEMIAKQMQKIEELTLYLIEQNKQITEQNKQIIDQNNQIDEMKKEIAQLMKNN